MPGSELPQTTSCGPKTDGRFRSGHAPRNKSASHRPDLVGRRFGWVEVISPEIIWKGGLDRKGHLARFKYLKVRCTGCGTEKLISYDNLLKNKTAGCQSCSQPRTAPRWLLARVTAMKSRCQNPNDPGYSNYGGRGIEFRFPTVVAGARYIRDSLGIHRDKELDRIDNDGHYEPGNLRWATRAQNTRNQRRARLSADDMLWAMTDSPYSLVTTRRMIAEGMSRQDVLESARLAVKEKRKNWRTIEARLALLAPTTSCSQGPTAGLPSQGA